MTRRAARLADLATEAAMDLDEAIVTLWDVGLDFLEEPHDLIPARNVRLARSALGLQESSESLTVHYWARRTGLTRHELAKRAAEVGVVIGQDVRRIPKGSRPKLERLFTAVLQTSPGNSTTESLMRRSNSKFEWCTIGTSPVKRYLTADDLREIHVALEQEFATSSDPIFPPGVKDQNLLESAVFRPHTSIGEDLKYMSQ